MFLLIAGGMGNIRGPRRGRGRHQRDGRLLPKSAQNLFGIGVFDLSKALDYFAVLSCTSFCSRVSTRSCSARAFSRKRSATKRPISVGRPVSRGRILASNGRRFYNHRCFNIASFLFPLPCCPTTEGRRNRGAFEIECRHAGASDFVVAAGAFSPPLSAARSVPRRRRVDACHVHDLCRLSHFRQDKRRAVFTLFQYFDAKDLLLGPYRLTGYRRGLCSATRHRRFPVI